MITKTAAVLVLVTSTSMCKLDNVDHAKVYHIKFPTDEECAEIAKVLQSKGGLSAYCEVSP